MVEANNVVVISGVEQKLDREVVAKIDTYVS